MRRLAVILALAVLAGGCSAQSLTGLPGPGGYTVTVKFRDVLDLEPAAAVRVADAVAGRVERVRLSGFTAEAVLRIDAGIRLPANAEAQIRQSSLLGEKYVELAAPDRPVGRLGDGAVIPLARTSRGIEVEEVLSALSVLVTGGGIEQIRTITTELSAALTGREDALRATLAELETFARTADAQKAGILRAITSIDRLATSLSRQRRTITTALDRIEPGLRVLAEQRAQLTSMLRALSRLGAAGARVVTSSSAAALADLRALRPILTQLDAAGTALPKALELLVTYPFPRTAAAAVAQDGLRLRAGPGQRGLVSPSPAPPAAPATATPTAPAKAPSPSPSGSRTPSPPAPAPSPTGGIAELLAPGVEP